MSDTEGGKKSGYRLEYASSSRSKCSGPKPCKGTPIGKGELRFGSLVDFRGNTSFSWRHWGCVTSKIISNMKDSFNEADELDGFDELKDEDQERIKKAWEDGHVAAEDVPETAKKADGDEEDEEEEKPKKKGGKKKAEEEDDGKGVFKFEYAASGRSKCKACGESIGKDYFRLGNEVDFRGNKSYAWRHWGCAEAKLVEKLKASYGEASEVDGFGDLQEGEKEKVQRAWDEGQIPDDDKGPGEPVETGKKKAAPRKKKAEDGEEKPKRSRAKAKKADDDDEMDSRPKKVAKKKKDEDESGEDFGDELAAVDEEEIDEEDEEPEEPTRKRKRAPASKGASSSKPPSKRVKPASTSKSVKPASSAKPASKAKPTTSRGKKKTEEVIEEEEEEDEYD
ncbi:transcription factor [Ganoderma sinense ZZ0214-1]|uniref:Transcription factor n=1 Tax=Ganoderma sinense ZZ0214-1 TaxID=1077348 RepID=A0A2G8S1V2_9APHY|nr:transcription factor [Ganoderma sinense ZZ0214-1]